ncbi:DMT family transporter [Marinomonas sp. GJ51-6]|uniref:DMT family transporter n=1 Tax=Marinomonas sp. GJ51-6 TaxID=2992802 RepID=UPI0029342191|nr:DMT family transporter [Marinomonas sp. GJ51-6]WOD07656.1 DMT family transporter [Marinomonas sp. GJ51-6]
MSSVCILSNQLLDNVWVQGMKDPLGKPVLQGYVFALIAVFIWTGFILISRAGSLASLSLYDMMMVRFGTAFVLFSPAIWINRKAIFQWKMMVLGCIGGLAYSLSAFLGFQYAPATHGALLLPVLMPIMIAFLAYFLAGERQSRFAWIGIGVSSFGILVLLLETIFSGVSYLIGDLSFISACFFWGIFTVLLRRWKFVPWHVTLGVITFTTLIFTPYYLTLIPDVLQGVSYGMIGLQAFYQGVIAVAVQFVCYGKAVHILGATKMGALMALVPLLASVMAVPLFGEPVTVGLLVALVCIILGTMIGTLLPIKAPMLKRRDT